MFPGVRNALLNCARKGTLRSVTLDEAHMFARERYLEREGEKEREREREENSRK